MKSLKQAVRDNRRFHKYEAMLRRIRLRLFDYEDEGKLEKAQHAIDRCKAICEPWWRKRAKRIEDRYMQRLA